MFQSKPKKVLQKSNKNLFRISKNYNYTTLFHWYNFQQKMFNKLSAFKLSAEFKMLFSIDTYDDCYNYLKDVDISIT